MRKIVMFDRVTPEGHFARPDGNTGWFVMDYELEQTAANHLPNTDAILLGRRTYQMFEKVWPRALEAPASDPHGVEHRSPAMRAFARFMNETTKWVFSRTLGEVGWRNSRLVRELDPREIQAMKRQPGKDIIVLGSGSIVSQLTQHALIDEYQLVVSPVLLGEGRPLFAGVTKSTRLDLLEAQAFPTGNVLLRYARAS